MGERKWTYTEKQEEGARDYKATRTTTKIRKRSPKSKKGKTALGRTRKPK